MLRELIICSISSEISELRTSLNECLAGIVCLILLEVLDESACKILSLCIPLSCISVCITGIKDLCGNAGKFCRYFEIEVRDLLCRSVPDGTVEDSIDDSSCIRDGDSLACSVPACVNEVSLSAGLLHLLYELFSVLCRMKLEECLTEASGECRCRLCDSALCTCKLSSESGKEVILCLLRCKDGNRRQNAESISGKEDYVLSSRAGRDLVNILGDLLDVIDRIRNTSILCN